MAGKQDAVQAHAPGVTGWTQAEAGEPPFSLERTYASGARYQPLIRQLEANGRANLKYTLTQPERDALMQNIRDILTHNYREAVNGNPHAVMALARQAELGRWRYLNQLPPEAQRALDGAMAKFNIAVHPRNGA